MTEITFTVAEVAAAAKMMPDDATVEDFVTKLREAVQARRKSAGDPE